MQTSETSTHDKNDLSGSTNCLGDKLFATGCDACGELGHCAGDCHLLQKSKVCVHEASKWLFYIEGNFNKS